MKLIKGIGYLILSLVCVGIMVGMIMVLSVIGHLVSSALMGGLIVFLIYWCIKEWFEKPSD